MRYPHRNQRFHEPARNVASRAKGPAGRQRKACQLPASRDARACAQARPIHGIGRVFKGGPPDLRAAATERPGDRGTVVSQALRRRVRVVQPANVRAALPAPAW